MAARPPIDTQDAALSLTMAVIESSPTPLLLLDGELRVAGASHYVSDAFGIDPATTFGRAFLELGAGEWEVPQLRALLAAIASYTPQVARRTSSTEARDQLKDAHHRAMSVAALERQLSASGDGDQSVELRTCFTSLCENIAASLIGDERGAALIVTGGGEVSSQMSVSLGLVVTELVINALKHAFPDGRIGRIEIGYQARGPNWTLSVRDDGVGMPNDADLTRTGLGTSIVQALARQLQATVVMLPAAPGTLVCIEHVQVALVGNDVGRAPAAVISERRKTSPERALAGRSNANGCAARR